MLIEEELVIVAEECKIVSESKVMVDHIYAHDQELIEEFHRIEKERKLIKEELVIATEECEIQADEEAEHPRRAEAIRHLNDTDEREDNIKLQAANN